MRQFLTIILSFFVVTCFSQNISVADDLFYNYEYRQAIGFYEKQDALKKDEALRLAYCYLKTGEYKKAANTYGQYLSDEDEINENDLFYAEALKNAGDYDKAKKYYERYRSVNMDSYQSLASIQSLPYLDSLKSLRPKYELIIDTLSSSTAADLLATKVDEGTIIVSELISDEEKTLQIKLEDETKESEIDLDYGTNLRPIAQLVLIYEGKKIPFTTDSKTPFHFGGYSIDPTTDKIYFTKTDITKTWRKFKEMPTIHVGNIDIVSQRITNIEQVEIPGFNKKKHALAHPLVLGDSVMYFSGNLEGTLGGFDLWKSRKVNGSWDTPVNLGKNINSKGDETFPFIKDSMLYFSSDGRVGYGGLDIYKSIQSKGSFSKAELLREPFNSAADDFGLFYTGELNEGGYVSSNRGTGKGDDDIYFFSVKKRIIQGVIRDKDGNPVEGAVVKLYDDEGNLVAEMVTGKDGKYRFEVLPDKSYTVVADWEGQQARMKFDVDDDWDDDKIRDISLKRVQAIVQGQVLDENGNPAANTLVKVVAINGIEIDQVKTDENGNFRFLVPVGNVYTVKASKKGYAAKKVIDVDENWDDNQQLSLKLREAVTSQGTVYNEDGTVAANTEISLYNQNGYLLEKSRTDENGRYQFILKNRRNYQMVAKKPGYEGVENIYTGKNWDSQKDVDLYLLPYTTVAKGKVTIKGEDGKPLEEVKIILTDEVTKRKIVTVTDKNGEFEVKLDKKRNYIMKMEKVEYYPRTIEMSPNSAYGDSIDLATYYNLEMEYSGYLIENIYFEFASARITRESKEQLKKLAKTMRKRPNTDVYIKSYADCRGSDRANEKISEARSKAVRKYLERKKVPKDRIFTKSMGATNFVNNCVTSSACSEEEHALNRRSEFELIDRK